VAATLSFPLSRVVDEPGIVPRPDSYEPPALTTVLFVPANWSGYRESNSVIHVGNVTRDPSRTSRILVESRRIELR